MRVRERDLRKEKVATRVQYKMGPGQLDNLKTVNVDAEKIVEGTV